MSTNTGHELTHGFDDDPTRNDAEGMLPLEFPQADDSAMEITDKVRHSGHLHPKDGGEFPVVKLTTTLAEDYPHFAKEEAPVAVTAVEAPVIEPPLPQTSDRKRNRWLIPAVAGGTALLAVVGVGLAVKANKGSDESPDRSIKPVAVSTRTPGASQTSEPTPSTSTTSVPSPSETGTTGSETNTYGLPKVPEFTDGPAAGEDLGTQASIPLSYLEAVMTLPEQKAAYDQLVTEYPEVKSMTSSDFMVTQALKANLSGATIATYQKKLAAVYANPTTARELGDPAGWLAPESINQTDNLDTVLHRFPAASDSYLSTIVSKYGQKNPNISLDMIDITSLSEELNLKNQEVAKTARENFVTNNEVTQLTYAELNSTKLVGKALYTAPDGSHITLVAIVSDYTDRRKVLDLEALVPVGDLNDGLPADSDIPVPYFTHTLSK